MIIICLRAASVASASSHSDRPRSTISRSSSTPTPADPRLGVFPNKDTGFVERALRDEGTFRARQGCPFDDTFHHGDAGSQHTTIHYRETLILEGLIPSIGTVGGALDNALCETTIGRYKTKCVRPGSPFRTGPIRTLADLENTTSAWVSWYNTARLMHRLGRIRPAEAEAQYYARLQTGMDTGHT